MGVLGCIVKISAHVIILFLLVVFLPWLPPENMLFESYSVAPTSPLEGPLKLNTKLNNAERLFEDELKGPEALAVYKGELYSGIRGGHLIKIKNNKVTPILKFGEKCDDLWEEPTCGRILGIKFDKDGLLYAVDVYYGIFKVNLTSGETKKIVAKDEIIGDKPVKCSNDIEVDNDGAIYWSDSSTTHELHDGVYTFLDNGNGRLIKTDLKTNAHEVLLDNLHFANGVVLSKDKSFVLVSETARARVIRYYLKGPKKGTSDIFIDGLPGLPDNLKRNNKGDFLIPLVKGIDANEVHAPFLLAPYPLIRKCFVRILTLTELSFKFLNDHYPTEYFKHAVHFLGNFDSLRALPSSNRVTIVKVNPEGTIIDSYHATDGKITDISDIEYFDGYYYLASPHNSYLGRVSIKDV